MFGTASVAFSRGVTRAAAAPAPPLKKLLIRYVERGNSVPEVPEVFGDLHRSRSGESGDTAEALENDPFFNPSAPGAALSQSRSSKVAVIDRDLLQQLYQELIFRKAHLRVRRGVLERYLEPCLVCLMCNGKVLLRTHEELEDGRVSDRLTLLTTKKMPEEKWEDAARRACIDELGAAPNIKALKFHDATHLCREEGGGDSSNMPGIATYYGLTLIKVNVTQQFADSLALRCNVQQTSPTASKAYRNKRNSVKKGAGRLSTAVSFSGVVNRKRSGSSSLSIRSFTGAGGSNGSKRNLLPNLRRSGTASFFGSDQGGDKGHEEEGILNEDEKDCDGKQGGSPSASAEVDKRPRVSAVTNLRKRISFKSRLSVKRSSTLVNAVFKHRKSGNAAQFAVPSPSVSPLSRPEAGEQHMEQMNDGPASGSGSRSSPDSRGSSPISDDKAKDSTGVLAGSGSLQSAAAVGGTVALTDPVVPVPKDDGALLPAVLAQGTKRKSRKSGWRKSVLAFLPATRMSLVQRHPVNHQHGGADGTNHKPSDIYDPSSEEGSKASVDGANDKDQHNSPQSDGNNDNTAASPQDSIDSAKVVAKKPSSKERGTSTKASTTKMNIASKNSGKTKRSSMAAAKGRMSTLSRHGGNTSPTDHEMNKEQPQDEVQSSIDSFLNHETFETRPFECSFWTKVQTSAGTRTRYWHWKEMEDLDNLDWASKMFTESPLLFSSLVQLREAKLDAAGSASVKSLLLGLEGSAPGKIGVAGKHDAGGKSKPYGAWNGLKWRYFGESVPPVPASVGGMRVNMTKPLFELCERVCSKVLTDPQLGDLVDELLRKGVWDPTLGEESSDPSGERVQEMLFKNILKSDGRRAKERVHEYLLRNRGATANNGAGSGQTGTV
ncbi:unnamed protein product [Amoebophrya sp. A120]|nr:unnamed protein product [Amoebophrya sp. A120]|eukprot:GSA120T00005188001.1